VAYLAHSRYGRNGTEVTINNNSEHYTGWGGNSVSEAPIAYNGLSAINLWTGDNGQKSSTTGNISGIYDMAGNCYEYQATYNKAESKTANVYGGNGGNSDLICKPSTGIHFAFNIHPSSDKYITAYNNPTSTNSVSSISGYYTNGKDVSHVGDAIHEVWVNNTTGWFDDYSTYICTEAPYGRAFLRRGANHQDGVDTGIFTANSRDGSAHQDGNPAAMGSYHSYRVCLTPMQ